MGLIPSLVLLATVSIVLIALICVLCYAIYRFRSPECPPDKQTLGASDGPRNPKTRTARSSPLASIRWEEDAAQETHDDGESIDAFRPSAAQSEESTKDRGRSAAFFKSKLPSSGHKHDSSQTPTAPDKSANDPDDGSAFKWVP